MAFTAEYFVIANGLSGRSTFISEATLTDEDLIRGDDADEVIVDTSNLPIFNGFTQFVQTGTSLDDVVRVFEDGEATTTVTFDDGTVLTDVLALVDIRIFSFGSTSNLFLLDQDALASVGKTLADVADVQIDDFIDHDLSYADLGFGDGSATPPTPDPKPTPDPEPTPDPVAGLIEGTDARDRLAGTDADEIIIGGDGNDRLDGNGGADVFVFGADAVDGDRDRDVIRDFDLTDDTLVLELGASIRNVVERNGDTILRLDGDRDAIVLRDVTEFSVDDIVFTDGLFLA